MPRLCNELCELRRSLVVVPVDSLKFKDFNFGANVLLIETIEDDPSVEGRESLVIQSNAFDMLLFLDEFYQLFYIVATVPPFKVIAEIEGLKSFYLGLL